MDKIKHIQQSIIAGALSENLFEKVSFLEVRDFDLEFQPVWILAKRSKGDLKQFYKLGGRTHYRILLVSDYTHIEILALLLLEYRYRAYLVRILTDYATTTESATEGLILAQTIEEAEDMSIDVFDLIERAPEYLEPYVSKQVNKKLIELQDYVNKRAEIIKQAI